MGLTYAVYALVHYRSREVTRGHALLTLTAESVHGAGGDHGLGGQRQLHGYRRFQRWNFYYAPYQSLT